jgi:pimeloyl-ACP methyl ester carboxylesterase
MGLGAFRTAWKRQTKYFGHDRSSRYSCLVLDNRGMGLSDKPSCRYSTSEMARDVIELVQHVGWLPLLTSHSSSPSPSTNTSPPSRDLHIIGISMGGMIAQELALLIPDHMASLSLISTAPRLVRTLPFVENLRNRINMFIPRDIDVQLDEIAHRLFADEWLAQEDTENEDPAKNFPTNRDRFAAGELQKRMDKAGFTRKGFTLQAIAAGWHFKSAEAVKRIGDVVGRERICVVHGTQDRMIDFHHFTMLKDQLGGEDGGAQFKVWDNKGHVLVWEVEDEFNAFLEARFEKCESIEQGKY